MKKIISETAKSTKEIEYCTDGQGGKYAVVRYRRKSDGKVYRTRFYHGA